MSEIEIVDGSGTQKFTKAVGSGATGDPYIPIGTKPVSVDFDFTRIAITDAGDVVSFTEDDAFFTSGGIGLHTLSNIASDNGAYVRIRKIVMVLTTFTTAPTGFKLLILNDSLATLFANEGDKVTLGAADISAWKLQGKAYVGNITTTETSGTYIVESDDLDLLVKTKSNSKDLNIAILAANSYTTAGSESFNVNVIAEQL